jgi:hypothetical protein
VSLVAVLTTLALAGVSFVQFREKPAVSPELMRLEVLTPDKTTLQKFAVSPDGRKIAFYQRCTELDGSSKEVRDSGTSCSPNRFVLRGPSVC